MRLLDVAASLGTADRRAVELAHDIARPIKPLALGLPGAAVEATAAVHRVVTIEKSKTREASDARNTT